MPTKPLASQPCTCKDSFTLNTIDNEVKELLESCQKLRIKPNFPLKPAYMKLDFTLNLSLQHFNWLAHEGYEVISLIVYLIDIHWSLFCMLLLFKKENSWNFYVFLRNVLCCYCSKMSNWLSRISLGIRARMMLHFDFLSPALFSWIALWRISRRPFPNYKLLNTKNFFWITWDLIE